MKRSRNSCETLIKTSETKTIVMFQERSKKRLENGLNPITKTSKFMTNPNITKQGQATRFSSKKQPAKNGRKISQISQICEEFEIDYDWKISKSDVKKLMQLLGFAPVSELDKLVKNGSLPAVVKSYIKALLLDIKVGRINTAKDIVELSFGKEFQKPEIEDKPETKTSLSQFSSEDILTSFKYGLPILDIEALEKVSEMVESEFLKRRMSAAKVIEN